MTNFDVVQLTNSLCSNQVDDLYKFQWLDELDRLVALEIHAAFPGLPNFTSEDPMQQREMLVHSPYDDMYRYYLEMMIHSVTGEVVKYNNALERFQGAYKAYGDYVCRTNRASGSHFKLY